jgi:hypothetical protein
MEEGIVSNFAGYALNRKVRCANPDEQAAEYLRPVFGK